MAKQERVTHESQLTMVISLAYVGSQHLEYVLLFSFFYSKLQFDILLAFLCYLFFSPHNRVASQLLQPTRVASHLVKDKLSKSKL
jgi:hypothetical protein